jgi:lysozyme
MKNGIDVSYHQGPIDWAKVKASGIDVAIIRAGYRTTVDKMAKVNVENALKNGLEIGLYWFIYVDKATIEDNAKAFLNFALPYKAHIKHMLWADWEYDTEKKSPIYNAQSRSNAVDEFCQIILKGGFDVGIYSNMDYIKSQKFTPQLIAKYPLWFARYTSAKEPGAYSQKGKSLYMWQYTSSGVVGGVSGYVDCNRVYDGKEVKKTYPTIKSGSRGDAVRLLQERLKELGYECGKSDGIFGQKTKQAVLQFQKNKNLKADGIVGINTWSALFM